MSATELEPTLNIHLDTARALQKSLNDAPLRIVADREKFKTHRLEGAEDWEGASADDSLKDPALVANDVAAQISFLRKLKFQYLEQNAKDKYIKTIVSDIDDAPLITATTNEELRTSNELKKEKLKAAKDQLAQKYQDIRTLAPLVEQDCNRAKALTTEATTLSQQILDARLALTRLRQAHPHPRLTVATASAHLESQVMQMQEFDEKVQGVNDRVASVKEKVKESAREVERLRVKRAEVEKGVKTGEVEVEDGRVVGLYDWFTASLDLHRSIMSLISSHSPSENSLVLTYLIPPRELTITLLFIPNTRQLAEAQVTGIDDIDVAEVVDSHILTNDVPGLVAAVLVRARAQV
ncbi:hypothetical protein PILCRDRAFT_828 [Piloderma croceum F 1598]|uniref:Kinetochore protein Sos7 coiled-coil domain-containing protein n=1 Tax=Piloderma croceum (strain F 1598) TaxID=765440 RepID=A0A0C3GJA8_PILCF|nr:hypothetical protein PILCRDRAFT_828 [Piloderma croceum F 1598]